MKCWKSTATASMKGAMLGGSALTVPWVSKSPGWLAFMVEVEKVLKVNGNSENFRGTKTLTKKDENCSSNISQFCDSGTFWRNVCHVYLGSYVDFVQYVCLSFPRI